MDTQNQDFEDSDESEEPFHVVVPHWERDNRGFASYPRNIRAERLG